ARRRATSGPHGPAPGVQATGREAARFASVEAGAGLLDLVGLDAVAFLEVGEAFDPDTALPALDHFLRVVLETTQGGGLALVHLLVLAPDADQRVAADETILHRGTGDGAQLRDVDQHPDLGTAELLLGADRLEQILHVLPDRVGQVVDDPVGLDLHALGLRRRLRAGLGAHVEAEDRKSVVEG